MTTTITSEEVAKIVIELQEFGDRLEAKRDPNWLKIARAAALLEALRLGIATIPDAGLPPRFIGVDLGKPGTERSVCGGRHA